MWVALTVKRRDWSQVTSWETEWEVIRTRCRRARPGPGKSPQERGSEVPQED